MTYDGWWMLSFIEDHSICSGYMKIPCEGVLNVTLALGSILRESRTGISTLTVGGSIYTIILKLAFFSQEVN